MHAPSELDSAMWQTCFAVFPGRYEMLQDNVEGYRREITSLHERTQKLTATTQKQEQIINTMTQDLRGANEKLAVAEVSNSVWHCGIFQGSMRVFLMIILKCRKRRVEM